MERQIRPTNFLICEICGILLEEGEDYCGNGHPVPKENIVPNSEVTNDLISRKLGDRDLN